MNAAAMAGLMVRLMERLGYDRFGVQGYDTGAWVAPEIGRQAPDRVVGVHVNAMISFSLGDGDTDDLPAADAARWARMRDFNDGYLQCDSKRPQNVTYGLHDSPAGQLAWIVEKFKELSMPEDALPEETVGRDRVLTDVSLYWLTGTIGSAAQIYYEEVSAGDWSTAEGEWDGADAGGWTPERGTVPTAVLLSAHDVTVRRWAERDHDIVRWTELDQGGHFLAMEAPDLLVADVREFFAKLR